MEAYTIEDVELLRRKAGMTYQEAVALLEYHNGNLAMALVDLENKGKLKEEAGAAARSTAAPADHSAKKPGDTKEKAINFLQKLYQCRVKVHKGETPVINLSVIFAGAALLFAPHITVTGVILAMILGYKFSFSQMDSAFASDALKKTVKNAAENARASVDSVVKTIQKTAEQAGKAEKPAQPARPEKPEIPEVPTIQVPVQAEAREGSVSVDEDQNGYHSVTIG